MSDRRTLPSADLRTERTTLSILQAIVLGITQGLTEFAPVSSSGHLILVPWLFGWHILDDPDLNKTFDVALHVGTLVGALVYFRRDVWRYLRVWIASIRARRIETADQRLAWALVLGTIPGAAAGAVFEDVIQEKLGQPWLIAVMLAVFGVVLYVVDRHAASTLSIDDISVGRGVVLGVAQAVALQPGVSRSGITMTVARWMGLDRESAARFSFLLALPIIAGAGAFKGLDLAREGFGGYAPEFFWGFVSSAISGFLVIWGLLRYLRRHDYRFFMLYRLVVAALVLVVIATGVRSAAGV
ncbi:MAG TPA: undecaprenyl-diphosphate phosphatase [Actinomycetota bacterium]|nr:undecaprenyl-diphosphate phosphatase [Actinomycetota bacterium]